MDIVEKLRNSGNGEEQWRVANPETGDYCMSFSRYDGFTLNPERDANEWLKQHKREQPNSIHANYEVRRVVVMDERDILINEAANEIERLRSAIQQTLDENGNLADGDNCTLIALKQAIMTPNEKDNSASLKAKSGVAQRSESSSPG